MTTRFEYKCNLCGHDYIEQRTNAELTAYFTSCNACRDGLYDEVNKIVLSEDPEIIVQSNIDIISEEVIPE